MSKKTVPFTKEEMEKIIEKYELAVYNEHG